MPNIKISYFNFRGRAEVSRLALLIADIPFEDERLSAEEWAELKPNTPYKALPVMYIDGEIIAQSVAMMRYTGKLSGLYPDCPLAAVRIDEVIDALEDGLTGTFGYNHIDKESFKQRREELVNEGIPRYYGGIEKRLEVFGSGPYACGDSITIADLAICVVVSQIKSGKIEYVPADAVDGYPRMMASYNAVIEHPKVQEWYKKYPLSETI